MGVDPQNVYVFGVPTKGLKRPLNGNDCMKKIQAQIPDLECPDLIELKELRKYCATVSQTVDLCTNVLQWLVNHVGQDSRVHYRY